MLNETAKQLLNKIETKQAVVGVVGLGYVGLPLAVEKAKAGYKVIGFDIQQKRVDMVNEGINYIGDVVDEELASTVSEGQFIATTNYSKISEVDAVAICVPTPLDKYQQPDTSYVEMSGSEIAKYLHEGMLIILESTTYPGTTEEILKPILEKSGYKVGEQIFLSYSPERVDPGNKVYNTKNTPKVVGGVTPACTEIAGLLYKNVLEGDIHRVSSPAVAEMEKILENTFRHINIALANEMAILCDKMGIDVWEVIDAAATKPYGFMPFYPGPGLGGHCIPIDPFYLTWKAREYNYHTRLIELAGEINNSMPEFVVNRCMYLLNKEGKALKNSKVLVLGVAYKRDIDDVRESPALQVLDLLEKAGSNYTVVDSFVKQFKLCGEIVEPRKSFSSQDLEEADLVLITTNHTDFDYELLAKSEALIFDTRNAFSATSQLPKNYFKL
jgi:UDP-N-acetyl-D-glucosamine dehydrogenase